MLPVDGTSMASRYNLVCSASSGEFSTIAFADPNTMRACSRSAAHE